MYYAANLYILFPPCAIAVQTEQKQMHIHHTHFTTGETCLKYHIMGDNKNSTVTFQQLSLKPRSLLIFWFCHLSQKPDLRFSLWILLTIIIN